MTIRASALLFRRPGPSRNSLRALLCVTNNGSLDPYRMKRRRKSLAVAINPLVVDLSHHNDAADFGAVVAAPDDTTRARPQG